MTELQKEIIEKVQKAVDTIENVYWDLCIIEKDLLAKDENFGEGPRSSYFRKGLQYSVDELLERYKRYVEGEEDDKDNN